MHFEIIDGTPLLEASYRLRFEIFCMKKQFFSPEWFPEGIESDLYDHYSIHVGCVDDAGVLVATARLVMPPPHGFPIAEHCVLFPEWDDLRTRRMAEISRLAITDAASRNPAVILGVYKLLYRASKVHQVTHWFAAMEKSLFRLLKRTGFDFRAIGPEQDYFGQVTPYLAAIAEIEQTVLVKNPALYEDFRFGLEPARSVANAQ